MNNKELIERYPFLLPRNRFTNKIPENFNYSYTELDAMPDGWRNTFGERMCEEIRNALIEANCLDKYRISQIKEKYGTLRWYDFGATQKVYDIISKYEYLSQFICDRCGKPADYQTCGWIENICNKCYNASKEKEKSHYHHDSILLDLQPCKFKYIDDKLVAIEQDYTDTWEKYLEKIK